MKENLGTTFLRLLALAQRDHREGVVTRGAVPMPGHQGMPWTSADLVHQDALYAVQSDLLEILLDVAESLGPAMVNILVGAMPWAYQEKSR